LIRDGINEISAYDGPRLWKNWLVVILIL
jgi:hypothetical protein